MKIVGLNTENSSVYVMEVSEKGFSLTATHSYEKVSGANIANAEVYNLINNNVVYRGNSPIACVHAFLSQNKESVSHLWGGYKELYFAMKSPKDADYCNFDIYIAVVTVSFCTMAQICENIAVDSKNYEFYNKKMLILNSELGVKFTGIDWYESKLDAMAHILSKMQVFSNSNSK